MNDNQEAENELETNEYTAKQKVNLWRSTQIKIHTWKVKDNQDRGFQSYIAYYDVLHKEDYKLQDKMANPL